MRVNSLTSAHAELSYDFYSLPYCRPAEARARRRTHARNPGKAHRIAPHLPPRAGLTRAPPQGAKRVAENLGEVLAGDRIKTSPIEFRLRAPHNATSRAVATVAALEDDDAAAQVLCQTRLRAEDAEALRRRIDEGYRAHMLLDNLPVRFRGGPLLPARGGPSC